MPNTVPASRVPQPQPRTASTVRSTSLRALAVAAHLERSRISTNRISTSRHGPHPAPSGSTDLVAGKLAPTSVDGAAEPVHS
jgi:hypothetical protein